MVPAMHMDMKIVRSSFQEKKALPRAVYKSGTALKSIFIVICLCNCRRHSKSI